MLILGHRGSRSAGFEQNSFAAFEEALVNADGLETDASRSEDGVIYLIHDTTFLHHAEYTLEEHLSEESAARVAGRRLDQMDSVEIETLRLKSGTSIPRLDGLLALARRFPGTILNIELKGDDCALQVVETLRSGISAGHVRPEQIIVSSYNHPALAMVRQHGPEFRIGALYSIEDDSENLLYPWSGNTHSRYLPFGRAALQDASMLAIEPDFINISVETLTQDNATLIRDIYPQAEIITWPWIERMPETDATLDYLLPFAADGLLHAWITDEPRKRKMALTRQSS